MSITPKTKAMTTRERKLKGPSSKTYSALGPYLQLMRVDKPAGLYAIYLPFVYGLLHGATISHPQQAPSPLRVVFLALVFLVGSILSRAAACTWNDYVDQDFDRLVARTRKRPIARGAVSNTQALLFMAASAIVAVTLLMLLAPAARIYALPITVLSTLYPFAKRFTNYPQLVLGFPFALAVPMASSAAGNIDYGKLHWFAGETLSMVSFFTAIIVWTILYDTIYAFQDLKDDVKAGVKSTAVRFSARPKIMLSILGTIQVCLLFMAGYYAQYNLGYYLTTCAGCAIGLAWMIYRVDLGSPESCGSWFKANFWIVGCPLGAGLLLTY
ncbi:UbiA prenyltransferase [Pseudovirgaria hyperparasitica]|uniref:4-hydroxybenzoate polyprenyltransferase, mitochondrial n=1 Tax=Pseudovirgaria hyperparasitica TaxID=470096 RepID=A0A6A6W9R5_9PEZI|nr:UbiA prenyltransferase [Pseudovirgaria hyperparasitica]KAF2758774.1 UbiA prenyltransferase [Pseudovirgaria hyperparasitica]